MYENEIDGAHIILLIPNYCRAKKKKSKTQEAIRLGLHSQMISKVRTHFFPDGLRTLIFRVSARSLGSGRQTSMISPYIRARVG